MIFVAAALSGCAGAARYAATARALSGTATRAEGFTTAWTPLGGDSHKLYDDEGVRARFFLDSCVSELGARFNRPPRAAVRAAQIEECMQARGWHLAVADVPQTR